MRSSLPLTVILLVCCLSCSCVCEAAGVFAIRMSADRSRQLVWIHGAPEAAVEEVGPLHKFASHVTINGDNVYVGNWVSIEVYNRHTRARVASVNTSEFCPEVSGVAASGDLVFFVCYNVMYSYDMSTGEYAMLFGGGRFSYASIATLPGKFVTWIDHKYMVVAVMNAQGQVLSIHDLPEKCLDPETFCIDPKDGSVTVACHDGAGAGGLAFLAASLPDMQNNSIVIPHNKGPMDSVGRLGDSVLFSIIGYPILWSWDLRTKSLGVMLKGTTIVDFAASND